MFFFFFFLIELKTKMSKGTGGFSIVFFNSFNGKVGSATACFRSVKLLAVTKWNVWYQRNTCSCWYSL